MDTKLDAREFLVSKGLLQAIYKFTALFFAFALLTAFHASAGTQPVKITVLGDSLVAGYGLGPGEGFPERLQEELVKKGYKVEITNAGISGDTSSGGKARLDWSVGEGTHAVILELGANDALRGIPPELTRKNIEAMILRLKERNIAVVLAGMMAPPNMGKTYGDSFNAIYPELAKEHDLLLYPFFLDGVAAEPELNQPDGIHPTAEGIDLIVEKFLPTAETLLKNLRANAL